MGKVDPRSVTEVDGEIGAAIRARRKELGLPMSYVAQQVGVSQQQFQKYETGQSRVSALMTSKIAGALDADPASFLPGAPLPKRGARAHKPDALATQLQEAFARIASTRERRLILALTKRLAAASPTRKRARN